MAQKNISDDLIQTVCEEDLDFRRIDLDGVAFSHDEVAAMAAEMGIKVEEFPRVLKKLRAQFTEREILVFGMSDLV